jgi:hypothetical protein
LEARLIERAEQIAKTVEATRIDERSETR